MMGEKGLRCDDDYRERKELAADLRKPGTACHALFFDTEALRGFSRSGPPSVSLLEVMEAGGRVTFKVLFWEDPRGPLVSPCVYVHAAKLGQVPQLCFHEEKGSWVLWKSPQPSCG